MTSPSLRADGVLHFEDVGTRIGPGFAAHQLEGSPLAQNGSLHVGPGWSRFSCRCRVEGRQAHATLTFNGSRLTRVELVLLQTTAGEPYSPAAERALKADHEAWMGELVGTALVPKPALVDGVPVEVDRSVRDWPRHAVFAWGEIVSAIDPRNGGSSVTLIYT